MAFEEIQPPAPPTPQPLVRTFVDNGTGLFNQGLMPGGPGWGQWQGSGITGLAPRQPAAPTPPPQLTYSFAPPPFVAPPALQTSGDLYNNPNAPWAIPRPAQQPDMGGWDSNAFMQGLRSLGFEGF